MPEPTAASPDADSGAWKTDPIIFRPDGRIHFPRSDGDLAYGPPSMQPPAPSEASVNYYHVFKPSEPKYKRWCEIIGADLARIAGKGEKTADGVPWTLHEFPRGYQFTEQRKGPRNGYRTDPYLFGSKAHRFRSTKEFVPHAEWLLSNPNMDTSRCPCKYCTGNRRQSEITAATTPLPVKRTAPKRTAAASGSGAGPSTGGRGRPRKSTAGTRVKVKAADLNVRDANPNGFLPPSVELRDKELSRASAAGKGHREGFRIGEHVWVLLEEPIADPDSADRYIDKWTAQIVDYRIRAHVTPQEGEGDESGRQADFGLGNTTATGGTFSLEGRVHQEMEYDVVLVGAPQDKAKVPESRLLPYMAGYPNDELGSCEFGEMSNHAWFSEGDRLPPKLHVLETSPEAKTQRPPFPTLLSSFAFSLNTTNYHRSAFRTTDRWEVPRNLPTAQPAIENGASTSGSTNDAAAAQQPESARAGEYFQGLFAGCERIWAGDLVRLRLRDPDVKDMMTSLAEAGKLARPSDATDACDLQGSYVMRIRTIRPPTDKPRNVVLVGSVYQVMTQVAFNKRRLAEEAAAAEAAAKQGESSEGASANGTDASAAASAEASDAAAPAAPSAGFAMPVFGALTGRGQQLPATPQLPDGLVLSPIAKDDREVEVVVQLLAGRIYPSLARGGDADEVDQMYANKKGSWPARNGILDRQVARLALIGAVPGHLNSIGIEQQRFDDGTQAMRESLELARNEIERTVKERILGPEAVQAEAEAEADADPIEDADGEGQASTTSNAAIEAIAIAAELSHGAATAARDKEAGGASASASGSGPASGAASPAGASGSSTGAANTTTTPGPGPGPAPGASKKRKAADPPPGTHSPAPSVRAAGTGTGASTGTSINTPTTRPSTPSTAAATTNADGEGRSLPPLPPGWEERKSRKGLGTFYVNIKTRETSWTRPKA